MKELFVYVRKLRQFAGLKLYLSMAGMLAASLLEGAGIFLLLPLLTLAGLAGSAASDGLSLPLLMPAPLRELPDGIGLPAALAMFAAILTGQAELQRRLSILSEQIEQGFIRQLRQDFYRALLQADWSFFLKQRRSDFIHYLTGELSRVSYGVTLFLQQAMTLLFTLVQLGLALWLSVELTVGVLCGGLLLALFARRYTRKSRRIGEATTSLMQLYLAGLTDHLGGMKEIKSGGMERQHYGWFQELCGRMERNMVDFSTVQAKSRFAYKAASALLIALFAYAALALLHVQAEKLALILIIFSRLWPKFQSLQSGAEQLAQSLPAFKALADLQSELAGVQSMDVEKEQDEAGPAAIQLGIACSGVYYRYDADASAYSLEDIRLFIPAAGTTAIVGQSGAGKSTLVDVLVGLAVPERGEVLIDGKPLTEADALALRRSVGYVSQDPFLFHASIRDNLSAAAPEASEEEMWEALRFAAADRFVRRLTDGLDTVLGDRGARLSGGERQRIVLARAILRRPAILILDEATSALDGENEALIQEALERLHGKMTIVVIAHRLSTIRGADQVVVMENGRIVQQGGYRELAGDIGGTFDMMLGRTEAG
ncbi:ABC transporter ATP-binding protein [Paenibacillus methanolicus]|uniref:ATP-binding cassette subfamily C protein n=1 Tax=Paenibacillus methanolicus TaxID=582686 RepID=A0A5S5CDG9_9BACL|nr:ABC transporter ATP-binding protein [Paenibacillus methanolicus]TYP76688.1 ATP-binding cassette subfamily C protein [Paenibacillus methanolicus]